LCDMVFCGLCHDCWKREVSRTARFLLLLMVGVLTLFFVMLKIFSP
jgi:hypothetical protein